MLSIWASASNLHSVQAAESHKNQGVFKLKADGLCFFIFRHPVLVLQAVKLGRPSRLVQSSDLWISCAEPNE